MKLNLRLAALAVAILGLLAACYPAGEGGICNEADEDRRMVDGVFMCFDDGDGYPTIYPPVTTPWYPTVG